MCIDAKYPCFVYSVVIVTDHVRLLVRLPAPPLFYAKDDSSGTTMPVLTEELTRFKAHRWQISCLEFHPNQSLLASGGWDKEAHIWDLSNLEVVHSLKGYHNVPITSLSWHKPNGLLLCTGSADNTVALWNADSGEKVGVLAEHSGWVLGSSFSATGSYLASASWDKTVRIWDPGSETLINTLNGHSAGVWSVDFHPRSAALCSCSEDGTIKIWDARTSKPVQSFSGGHSDAIYCAKWSPDGAMIASGSADTKVCIWEPRAGAVINTIYGHTDTVKGISFNPRRENVALPVLASCGDFSVRLSDPRPTQKADILTLSPHMEGKEIEDVAISPDGSLVVSGGRDGVLVLMTLLVPSVIPRSDTSFNTSTSAILRRSTAVRQQSYIHDATIEESTEDADTEEAADIEAEMEADELDRMLSDSRATKNISFTRMKRRSRFGEKGIDVMHATIRRKGTSAKISRERRVKGKEVDIPTMVAHLSAATRAYGPEEMSSSESEDEDETRKDVSKQRNINVSKGVTEYSKQEPVVPPKKPFKHSPSIDAIGNLGDVKVVFEKNKLEELAEEDESLGSLHDILMPRELDNTLERNYNLDASSTFENESLMFGSGHYALRPSDTFSSGFPDDSSIQFPDSKLLTSSHLHAEEQDSEALHKQAIRPTLAPSLETESNFADQLGSGDEYGDDVPLSMI